MKVGVNPITPERLNALMAKLRPGSSALAPREGCVEGAIGTAVNSASYHLDSDEPNDLHVAAYLLRSLAKNHCYIDGNKRIAWLACLEVLAVHSAVTIEADQDEAAEVVERVAQGQMAIDELINWLAMRLCPLRFTP